MNEVDVVTHGRTAVVTLNAPDRRNVLSAAMVAAIGAAFDRLERDEAVCCVVLTGAGRAFCAGAELSVLESAAAGDFELVRSVYDGFLRVLGSPLVTIAAVNGPAVGAGFNLALACDVRLAADSAVFDTRFMALGLHPGGGHTWLLTQAVGTQQATLATVFGQVWNVEEALARGLVAGVHPGAELLDTAIALGRRLDDHDPALVRRLIGSLRAAPTSTHAEALALETTAQAWSITRPAFLERLQTLRHRIAAR